MELLTPKQLAGKACISRSLVYALVREGKIPAYRVGVSGKGKILVRWEDWESFLETCRVSEWPTDDGVEAFARHAKPR